MAEKPHQTSRSKTTLQKILLSIHIVVMNTKSTAEAFARSLHCKLRSLTLTPVSYENNNAAGDDSTSDTTDVNYCDQFARYQCADTPSTDVEDETNNQVTSCREIDRLTGNSADKSLFDPGFCSPGSPTDVPASSSSVSNCHQALTVNTVPLNHPKICQYFHDDGIEESGCISSVSSTLTEQDNDDDDDDDDEELDFGYFKSKLTFTSSPTPPALEPKKIPNTSDILADQQFFNLTDIIVPKFSGGFHSHINSENPQSWEAKESGFLPISSIQQSDLQQGHDAIHFKNSTQVVDTENYETPTDVETNSFHQTDDFSNNGIEECNQLETANNGDVTALESDGEVDTQRHTDEILINLHLETETDICTDQSSPVIQKLTLHSCHDEIPAENSDESSILAAPPSPDDVYPMRVRRASSLKTCKTPPGTPNRKKIVRFADAMGLDLEDVKTVFLDDLPVVPSSAFKDLESSAYKDEDECDQLTDCGGGAIQGVAFNLTRTTLVPVFPQPGSLSDFFDRLRKQAVCLESAVVTGRSNVRLVIRVLNLNFMKEVTVRHTSNEWKSFQDASAEYVENSNDVFSDKYYIVIQSGHLQVGERLCFAITYKTQGKEYWDNNKGQNYIFQCFPEHERQLSPSDDSWIHFL